MAKRLGKRLDSLLGAVNASEVSATAPEPQQAEEIVTAVVAEGETSSPVVIQQGAETFTRLPLEQLKRGRYQPREDFNPEALQELSESIRFQGVIQPLVVRDIGEDRYEIIAGERRWRAAKLAGLVEIPVIIREASDLDTMAIALIENLQREELNPIEEAYALQRLIDEFGLTQQQTADAIGRSRSTVTNQLRLLNLNAEVGLMVERRELDRGHARTLLGLEGKKQIDAAKEVVSKGMSVRDTERLVRRYQLPPKPVAEPQPLSPTMQQVEALLVQLLDAEVAIQPGREGAGKVVIRYRSEEELEQILNRARERVKNTG